MDEKIDIKIDAVIPAAGSGQRFGACQPKQVLSCNFYFLRGYVVVVKLLSIEYDPLPVKQF